MIIAGITQNLHTTSINTNYARPAVPFLRHRQIRALKKQRFCTQRGFLSSLLGIQENDKMNSRSSPRATAAAVFGLLAVTTSLVAAQTKDTPSPNNPIPKPVCNVSQDVSIRYSSSTKRLYVEGMLDEKNQTIRGGCVTLNEIFLAREGKPPLFAVNSTTGAREVNATGTWLLTEELFVEDGITLQVSELVFGQHHERPTQSRYLIALWLASISSANQSVLLALCASLPLVF